MYLNKSKMYLTAVSDCQSLTVWHCAVSLWCTDCHCSTQGWFDGRMKIGLSIYYLCIQVGLMYSNIIVFLNNCYDAVCEVIINVIFRLYKLQFRAVICINCTLNVSPDSWVLTHKFLIVICMWLTGTSGMPRQPRSNSLNLSVIYKSKS